MGEISKKLGLRIKELREKQGYTQLKLAEILNMEASNLSKIEIPKEESLEKLAQAFNVNLRDLFDYEHFTDKSLLISKINKILENSDLETVQKYYRILINL